MTWIDFNHRSYALLFLKRLIQLIEHFSQFWHCIIAFVHFESKQHFLSALVWIRVFRFTISMMCVYVLSVSRMKSVRNPQFMHDKVRNCSCPTGQVQCLLVSNNWQRLSISFVSIREGDHHRRWHHCMAVKREGCIHSQGLACLYVQLNDRSKKLS